MSKTMACRTYICNSLFLPDTFAHISSSIQEEFRLSPDPTQTMHPLHLAGPDANPHTKNGTPVKRLINGDPCKSLEIED